VKKKSPSAAAVSFCAFSFALFLVPAHCVPLFAGEAADRKDAAKPAQAAVTAEEVARAIRDGAAYIKSRQLQDGSWPYDTAEHRQGVAALAVFALSESGVPDADPAIAKGLEFVESQSFKMTYDAACAAMAITSLGSPGSHMNALARARDFLVRAQVRNGMWAYEATGGGGDNSNTQFALLGLYAASALGLGVPEETWSLAEKHYTSTQNRDGGWGYVPGQPSRGSMTAAAAGILHVLGARLYVETDKCGTYRQDPRMAGGIRWLEKNFSVTEHPGGEPGHHNYYLYALERVGVFTGERYIGAHDWYLEGARYLVDIQNKDGSWRSGRDVLPNTCFALLFLAKGNVPVLINKLNYGGEWNVDAHDAENLTRYVSAKLGQRVGWQSVKMTEPLETFLAAPILYVTGHKFPAFSPDQTARMRTFFEQGGFLFAESCCGSKEFDRGLRLFASAVFPDVPLAPLDKSDPVYRAFFNLSTSARAFEGVKAGCRLNLVYSPSDLSCIWEKNDTRGGEEAFQFGANIAAYVTGKERLVPRLEQFKVVPSKAASIAAPGAFTLAQISYASGNWNPHPGAGPKLLQFMNEKAGLSVTSEQVNIALTDKNLANYPFIYLTGCKRFTLSDEEKKALREYLERGGFLFADAACGKPEFDESFKALAADLFPAQQLETIPPDSPVYHIAFDTTRVTYTTAVRELNPSLSTLTLYAVNLDGRTAVVYSPYDIGCALEQFPAYGARGLLSEDAFKVATNIVLFALSH